ncbi:hypothetical protein HMJ40_19820 [Pseudomonas aeruginosa]|nr:hypothetical protein HMJ40_19820 [Pseudomonas aeruginosa]
MLIRHLSHGEDSRLNRCPGSVDHYNGSESSQFKFTSALPVQVLKGMAPLLRDYLDPRTATRCQVPLSPQQIGRL